MTSTIQSNPLRPTTLAEFSGQPAIVAELTMVLSAAQMRKELPDHVLLSGPPGLGKTTLARIIALEMGLSFVATSGPSIERPGDMAAILTGLRSGTALFIDELHRLPPAAQEILYPAMEDRRVDLVVGQGAQVRALSISLEPFVVIGATTQPGSLAKPLRDRFGYQPRLSLYSAEALSVIAQRTADLLEVPLGEGAAAEIAFRGQGTPRVVNRMVGRVRDWATTNGRTVVSAGDVVEALAVFGFDDVGLDRLSRDVLRRLCDQFGGGPVGVGTLAASVSEPVSTLSDSIEPLLMHLGLLARTSRGRVATAAAFRHLGLDVPAEVLGAATLDL